MSSTKQNLLQNIIIVVDVFVALVLVFVLIYHTLEDSDETISQEREKEVMAQTAPVGRIRTDSSATVTPAQEESIPISDTATSETTPGINGQAIYDRLCFSCHGTGLPNIPQLGVADDWSDRIAQGSGVLYERAINGYTGDSGMVMPARGGNPALTDDEVRAAVDYMVDNSR